MKARSAAFLPVATDMGFCLAANAEPLRDILAKDHTFGKVFDEAFPAEAGLLG